MFELYFKANGRVQGVGYRYFAYSLARRFGLRGFCRNSGIDSFECIVQGAKEKLEEFLKEIKKGPDAAKPINIESEFRKPEKKYDDFQIL